MPTTFDGPGGRRLGRAVATWTTEPTSATAASRTLDRRTFDHARVLDPTRTAPRRADSVCRVPSTSTMRLGRRRTAVRTSLTAALASVVAASATLRLDAARAESPLSPCVVRGPPTAEGVRSRTLVDDLVDVVPDERGATRLTARVALDVSDRSPGETVVTRPLRTTGARRDGSRDACFDASGLDLVAGTLVVTRPPLRGAVWRRTASARLRDVLPVDRVPGADWFVLPPLRAEGARRAGADRVVLLPLRTAGARREAPRVCAGADAVRPESRPRARARWSSTAAVASCGTVRKTADAKAIVNDVKRDMTYPFATGRHLLE